MIKTNNIVICLIFYLLIGCIQVPSTESRERKRSRYWYKVPMQRIHTFYQSTNYAVPASMYSNKQQMYQQREKRKLDYEIIDELLPITKEYGSVGKFMNTQIKSRSRGKVSGSSITGKGISEGKGTSQGKSMGKGGKENTLPMICNNFSDMTGSGKGASKSKSKSKGKTSMYSSKAKNRALKGIKGRGKSKQMNKGKGSTQNDKCSKFVYGKDLRQPLRHSSYASLLDIAREIPEISVFMSLLNRFDLTYILECDGPYTGLIPTNDAFGLLDPILFADLLLPKSGDDVERLILNHLFRGIRANADFMEGTILSLAGTNATVLVDPLTFNNIAKTVTTDIFGSNGVLHLIDRVLFANGTIDILIFL